MTDTPYDGSIEALSPQGVLVLQDSFLSVAGDYPHETMRMSFPGYGLKIGVEQVTYLRRKKIAYAATKDFLRTLATREP